MYIGSKNYIKNEDTEGKNMKCPHLINWITTASCKAKDTLYYPSPYQFNEYCNKKYHQRCPFYMESSTVGETYSTKELCISLWPEFLDN